MQATCAGAAIAIGAVVRDLISAAAVAHDLGQTLAGPATGYGFVYALEIVLLLGTLIVLGPLVRPITETTNTRFGLAEFPA